MPRTNANRDTMLRRDGWASDEDDAPDPDSTIVDDRSEAADGPDEADGLRPSAQRPSRSQRLELLLAAGLVVVGFAYLVRYMWLSHRISLWNDEIYSIDAYSSGGPIHAATNYNDANNHVLFNVLASLVPGPEFAVWRVRAVAYAASLLTFALLVYEFARRRWYLVGAAAGFAVTVNEAWLNLVLQGRGYALLGLAATVTSLALWRFLEDGRRRWLIVLLVGSVVGVWTIPSFVFFAAPMWVCVLACTRRRDVLVAAVGTGAAIAAVYAPIVGQLRGSFATYASEFGRSYTSPVRPFDTMQIYVFHAEPFTLATPTFALGPIRVITIVSVLAVLGLAYFPFAAPFPRTFSRILASSILAMFAICLYLQTPPDRTVAFVVVPFLLIAACLGNHLLDHLAAGGLRSPRSIVAMLVALSLGTFGVVQGARLSVRPIEDWKAVGAFVNQFLPPRLAIASKRGRPLAVYVSSTHPLPWDFDAARFASGSEAYVQEWPLPAPDVAAAAPVHGEVRFPQVWGLFSTVLISRPTTSGVAAISQNGRPLDVVSATTGTGVGPPPPIHSSPVQPLVLSITPTPDLVARTVVVVVPPGNPRLDAVVTVVRPDGSRAQLPPKSVVSGPGTIVAYLGDQVVGSVTVRIVPSTPTVNLFLQAAWFYPRDLTPAPPAGPGTDRRRRSRAPRGNRSTCRSPRPRGSSLDRSCCSSHRAAANCRRWSRSSGPTAREPSCRRGRWSAGRVRSWHPSVTGWCDRCLCSSCRRARRRACSCGPRGSTDRSDGSALDSAELKTKFGGVPGGGPACPPSALEFHAWTAVPGPCARPRTTRRVWSRGDCDACGASRLWTRGSSACQREPGSSSMKLRRSRPETGLAHDVDAARAAWPEGHRAALSLSFDDARHSQIAVGVPFLDSLGVPVTFFVLPDGVSPDRRAWHGVVERGHEIGNHTARHPCSANFGWSRHHAIEDLDLDAMAEEIEEASAWISVTLGVEARSFAYPCGHTYVGRGRDTRSVVPLVADRFLAGRTFNDVAINAPLHCDLAQISAMNSDGLTFEQLRPILETALGEGSWLVLGGHEVGHLGDAETTMLATVAAVVDWCRSNDVWIDSIGNVAGRVHAAQQLEPAARHR